MNGNVRLLAGTGQLAPQTLMIIGVELNCAIAPGGLVKSRSIARKLLRTEKATEFVCMTRRVKGGSDPQESWTVRTG